jgi:hypothetical protein
MSVIVLASVKGSPGVTTTACLLGATWPNPERIVVGECDPAGSDLAPRFALSVRQGWTSLALSVRRSGGGGPLGEHLQLLPGGLRVLVGTRDSSLECARLAGSFLDQTSGFSDGPWALLVDIGRILPGSSAQSAWLDVADRVVVVLRTDASAVLHVKGWTDPPHPPWRDRLGLVTVGARAYSADEIERFTSSPVIGHLPEDPDVAGALCGSDRSRRRLRRSPLVAAAASLAAGLSEVTEHLGQQEPTSVDGIGAVAEDHRRRFGIFRTKQPWFKRSRAGTVHLPFDVTGSDGSESTVLLPVRAEPHRPRETRSFIPTASSGPSDE